MNWKIINFFMIAYYIELILTRCSSEPPENMEWRQESQQEKLYDKGLLKSLTFVTALDDQDVSLLSSECQNRLNWIKKKESIKKYHDIMEGILSVNREYMAIMLDNIIHLMKSEEKSSLEMLVKQYFLHITRILSLLHVAQWEVPIWQVKFFIFLNDLVSMDLQSSEFSSELIMKFRSFEFIILGICIGNKRMNTRDVYDILWEIENLYNNDKLQCAYEHAHHMTVQKLMLVHLYENHEDFTQNSKLEIVLDWESVNSIFALITYFNKYTILNKRTYGLLLQYYIRYHTLLLNCFQVRMLFYTWFHVKWSIIMLSTYTNSKPHNSMEIVLFPSEIQVQQYWLTLVDTLKHILRIFSIKDDIYWFALRNMMNYFKQIEKIKIVELEIMLKNEFLSMVKKLDLGEEKYITEQLETLSTVKDSAKLTTHQILDNTFEKITANLNDLKSYTSQLQQMLTPVDASFVSWFFDKTRSVDTTKTYK